MNKDLSLVLGFRRVLERAAAGMGMNQALARELRGTGEVADGVLRGLMLGFPLQVSLKPVMEGPSREGGMLASLMVASKNSSVTLAGKRGEGLSYLAEGWIKARESQRLEDRVRRARSLVASGVAGAVSAMIAAIGPLLGSLSISSGFSNSGPQSLAYVGAALALLSSGALGTYTSGRRFYANVMVTATVYLFVSLAVAPLADFPSTAWAIK